MPLLAYPEFVFQPQNNSHWLATIIAEMAEIGARKAKDKF
jgi:hypothetical protein